MKYHVIADRYQKKLKSDGFYAGLLDGKWGPKSQQAMADSMADEYGAWYSVEHLTDEDVRHVLPSDVLRKGLFYKSRNQEVRDFPLALFSDLLRYWMQHYGINTPIRMVHLLAQVGLECDRFRTTEEYRGLGGRVPKWWHRYDGGYVYHGRGLIQLTHRYNYKKFQKDTGYQVVEDPALVAKDVDMAIRSACWYWRYASPWGDCNRFADKDDFIKVTMAVNGGFNHIKQRKQHLNTFKRQFDLPVNDYYLVDSGLARSKVGRRIWKRYFKNNTYV